MGDDEYSQTKEHFDKIRGGGFNTKPVTHNDQEDVKEGFPSDSIIKGEGEGDKFGFPSKPITEHDKEKDKEKNVG